MRNFIDIAEGKIPNLLPKIDRNNLKKQIKNLKKKYPSGDVPFSEFRFETDENNLPREFREYIKTRHFDDEYVDDIPIHLLVPQAQNGVGINNLRTVLEHWDTAPLPELVKLPDGRYWICEGHHRICLSIMAGYDVITAFVFD